MKELSRLKGDNQLDVFEVVKDLRSPAKNRATRRDQQCKDLFRRLCNNLSLRSSTFAPDEVVESLAVSFLVCPERLVWNRDKRASFLGVNLVHQCKHEFFVVALLSNPSKGLQCHLSLPVTDWVVRKVVW